MVFYVMKLWPPVLLAVGVSSYEDAIIPGGIFTPPGVLLAYVVICKVVLASFVAFVKVIPAAYVPPMA